MGWGLGLGASGFWLGLGGWVEVGGVALALGVGGWGLGDVFGVKVCRLGGGLGILARNGGGLGISIILGVLEFLPGTEVGLEFLPRTSLVTGSRRLLLPDEN